MEQVVVYSVIRRYVGSVVGVKTVLWLSVTGVESAITECDVYEYRRRLVGALVPSSRLVSSSRCSEPGP